MIINTFFSFQKKKKSYSKLFKLNNYFFQVSSNMY